ncbi:TPA: hypothetical protein TXI81_001762 [Streptococcus suis]|nr:hypothetical protein [Streptococcus suis]
MKDIVTIAGPVNKQRNEFYCLLEETKLPLTIKLPEKEVLRFENVNSSVLDYNAELFTLQFNDNKTHKIVFEECELIHSSELNGNTYEAKSWSMID